ncbi:MAG: FAD-dependent oxidoreductase, partial [Pseudomonadota bacterium]
GPGMLGGTYEPRDLWFNVEKTAKDRGAEVVFGRVTAVEAQNRSLVLASGQRLEYDIASLNLGSEIPGSEKFSPDSGIFPVKPIDNLLAARHALDRALKLKSGSPRVVVVGGGPAGAELCGNILKRILDQGGKPQVILAAGGQLLQGYPDKARRLVLKSLTSRGAEIIQGPLARDIAPGRVGLEDGRSLEADLIFLAWGTRAPRLLAESGLPVSEDGSLLVNRHLQSVGHPELFGGGDCVTLSDRRLDKVGVYAVRENPVLWQNLLAKAEGRPLISFDPGGAYLLIFNLGDGRGILRRKDLVLSGRALFRFKDWLDRRFVRRFQVSGEAVDS